MNQVKSIIISRQIQSVDTFLSVGKKTTPSANADGVVHMSGPHSFILYSSKLTEKSPSRKSG